ncbi:MAG: NAD(P)/FAD-dependent oxidoreductase [Opitutales bacterium]
MAPEEGIADVLIVGSGIAAQAAGHRLILEGWRVILLDKARGVGGRMASRRFGGATFDHGANFFTVRSHEFSEIVNRWQQYGLIDAWFHSAASENGEGHFRYRGKPSMTAIAKHFDKNWSSVVREAKVTQLSRIDGVWRLETADGRSFFGRALILTPPMPQSLALLEPLRDLIPAPLWEQLAVIRYTRTLTAMLRLEHPSALPDPGLIHLDDPEPLMTLIDNQQKGISEAPAVTLHAGPGFSERYYGAPNEEHLRLMVEAAQSLIQSQVVESQVHRWGFATCLNPSDLKYAVVPPLNLWLAGDSFRAARVEAAYLSGREAAVDATARLAQQGAPEGSL